MAIRPERLVTTGEGLVTCDLTYDDVTGVAARLQATNGHPTGSLWIEITRADGTRPQTRTVLPGGSLDLALSQTTTNRLVTTRRAGTQNMDGLLRRFRFPA